MPEGTTLSFTWSLRSDKGPVQVSYQVRSNTGVNPLEKDLLRFRCPASVWAADH